MKSFTDLLANNLSKQPGWSVAPNSLGHMHHHLLTIITVLIILFGPAGIVVAQSPAQNPASSEDDPVVDIIQQDIISLTASDLVSATYTTVNGLSDNRVWDIVTGPDGRHWVGAYKAGVSVFNGQNWLTYTTVDGLVDNDVRALLFAPDGRLWLGTGGGISVFDGTWQSYQYGPDSLSGNAISALAADAQGTIWAATVSEGINRFQDGRWTTFTVEHGLISNFVLDLAVDGSGQLWIATGDGVSVFNGQSWKSYTMADGLVDNTVFAVTATPAGHLWFGTANGLSQLVLDEANEPRWINHLPNRPVYTLKVDAAGQLWAAGGGLVSRFDGQQWSDYLPDHFKNQDIRAITVDSTGAVWVGSFGDGLTKFASNPYWHTLAGWGDTFSHLAATPGGAVWAIGGEGLLRFSDSKTTRFDLPPALAAKAATASYFSPAVTDLAAVGDNTVWVATFEDGLYRFIVTPTGEITSIVTGATSGTIVPGLINQVGWQQFTTADGLPASRINQLAVDAQNRLWAIFQEMDQYVLAYIGGESWQSVDLPVFGLRPNGLAPRPNGQVWLSIPGKAPFLYDGTRWVQPVEGWQAGSFDMFVAAGPTTPVWFGSDNGWQQWDSNSWRTPGVSIPAPFSYPAAVDTAGGVWGIVNPFCYWCKLPNLNENGAVYVTMQQSCRFTAFDGLGGLPLNPIPFAFDPQIKRPDAVHDIVVAADGRVWFIAQGRLTIFNPQGDVCARAVPENVRHSK